MHTHYFDILWSPVALAVGTMVGYSFGFIQEAARRRNQQKEQQGQFKSGWASMPSSFRRVSYLVLGLALVQIVCPMLFVDGIQWWVSGGVVAGYGWQLYKQLRQSLSNK